MNSDPVMNPEVSIVVPMFNENENVLPLARAILKAFNGQPQRLELVLVDDHSTDGTWERIQEACRVDPRIRGVRHNRNGGQSAALWTGFKVSRGQIIATLDGDLQNDPADLPRLLAELANCDLVCGVRTKRMDNFIRRMSSRIARWARRAVLGVDFRDTGCNLRVFKRWVLDTTFPFNGLHRFMPILADGGGAVVREIEVVHHPRAAGQSKYGVWNRLGRGIYDLMAIRWYRHRQLRAIPTVETPASPELNAAAGVIPSNQKG
jgi:glycosyltransferase involved in cell wall biosynthesis